MPNHPCRLLILLASLTSPAVAATSFDRYELITGPAPHQTVLTGFLLGGAVADLAVVRADSAGARDLRLYSFADSTWVPALRATLRPDVAFVDIARIDGRDRLLTYAPGRLHWFDTAAAVERPLAAVASAYGPDPDAEVVHLDITRDINGDGRDDLVVPDSDGFWVLVQRADGAFAKPLQIGPALSMAALAGEAGYRRDPWRWSRVWQIDYNLDGRDDLAYWRGDRFAAHLQDERGLFAPAAVTFAAGVAFDSDDPAALAAPYGTRRRRKDQTVAGAMSGRVLHSLRDHNGDGVADLAVYALRSGKSKVLGQMSQLWRMRSSYEVHFGAPTAAGGIAFAPEPGAVARVDGIPFAVEPHAVDGRTAVAFTVMNPGLFRALGWLIGSAFTGTVPMDLAIYQLGGGRYPGEPSATRTIKAAPGGSGERTGYPAVLVGDISGDGHPELLIQQGEDKLMVYAGVPEPGLFAARPQKVAVAMPGEGRAWLADLNGDGGRAVVMHHPDRVTALVAR